MAVKSRIIDPTANVTHMITAEMKRQDDLRFAESRRVKEQMDMHASYTEKLALAESKWRDAARQGDMQSANTKTDSQAAAILALAATTATNAENLRATLAANTAASEKRSADMQSANAKLLSDAVLALTTRIAPLESAIAEGKGKEAVADPMLVKLVDEVQKLHGSKAEGISLSWSVLVSIILIVIAIGSMMYTMHPAPQQVIYAPAPATQTK